MTGRYLVDTNVIIAALKEEEDAVRQLNALGEVFVSSIVIGELYFGAVKSEHPTANVQRIDQLCERIALLCCDQDTARAYGEIKAALRALGRPIPENDIWIAATAIQHGLTLITRDAHFESVAGLSLTRS